MHRLGRVVIWSALVLAVPLVAAASAQAAPCATAGCPTPTPTYKVYADARPGFTGWGMIDTERCQTATLASYCRTTVGPGNPTCHHEYRPGCEGPVATDAVGYRWTGAAWAPQLLYDRRRAYIHPYGSGWSWAWTHHTGWVAVRSEFALTNRGVCYFQRNCPTY